MQIITERLRTPVTDTCDVLVAGGGIAGCAAALAAAREGAKVMLVEPMYLLGGLATAGLIAIYLPLCDGMGRQVSFGISEMFLRLSIEHGAQGRYPQAWLTPGREAERLGQRFLVQFNPQLFAISLQAALLAAGVTIRYGAKVCAVRKEADRVTHAIVERKEGRAAIALRTIVDATGDADVCHLAGAPTQTYAAGVPLAGNPPAGNPPVGNPLAAWYYLFSQGEVSLRMLGASDKPGDLQSDTEPQPLSPDRFTGLTAESLSRMTAQSHAQVLRDVLAHRQDDAASVPVTLMTLPQVRMTRRLAGAFTLDRAQMHTPFADGIGHIGDWRVRGPAYEIPFGTLYSPKVKNLITAGRCISVTDAMWDITRAIPACAVTGEAAGMAAALTEDFAQIDVQALRARLRAAGALDGGAAPASAGETTG